MKYVVDRIENDIAICEDINKTHVSFPIKKLFKGITEGDHFEFANEKCVFLEAETNKARNRNIALQNSLFED